MTKAEFLAKYYYHDLNYVNLVNTILNVPGVYTYGEPAKRCVSAYIMLSDFGVDLLRNVKDLSAITKPFIFSLLNYPGDSAFVFMVASNGFRSMRRDLREGMARHHPSRILWLDEKHMLIQQYLPHCTGAYHG